jgi:hypothetical protein
MSRISAARKVTTFLLLARFIILRILLIAGYLRVPCLMITVFNWKHVSRLHTMAASYLKTHILLVEKAGVCRRHAKLSGSDRAMLGLSEGQH